MLCTNYQNELISLRLICHYCGVSMEEEYVNTKCGLNNSDYDKEK